MARTEGIFSNLTDELDKLAEELGVESVLIMKSTDTHMRVAGSAGPQEDTYKIGAEGKKGSAFEEAHELYCERVVDRQEPLFVRDSRNEAEWSGNEDEVEFGLFNYLGYPLKDADGSIYGTVCVLDNEARDYSEEERRKVEALRDRAQNLLKNAP